jgi:hypothetical protein
MFTLNGCGMNVPARLQPHLAIRKFAVLIRLARRYDGDFCAADHDADRIEIMAMQ